jgi:acyl-CoA reductase-like NAD-dependent aldehyde dehydrogenase
VRSVCFTGSIPVGRQLATLLAGDLGKDVALELGGKCATIVLRDADLALAAKAVADAMCLTCGQRCNATSRVMVEDAVAAEFEQLLLKELDRYVPGDPMSPDTKLGPLVSVSAVERYARLTALDADRWLKVGRVLAVVDEKRGHYVTPAVACFDARSTLLTSAQNTEEAFAPILSLVRVTDVDEAVAVHDLTPYGLTASVFTRSREQFERLVDRLEVGNVYANLPTTFSPSTLPFGGLKSSGNRHPGGRGFIRFTTNEQAVQELAGQWLPE